MRSTLHKQSFPPVRIPVFQSLYTHKSHNVMALDTQQSAYFELGTAIFEHGTM